MQGAHDKKNPFKNNMRRRRTEITIETRKLTIIRTSASQHDLAGCQQCGGNVSTIQDRHAIALGLDEGRIFELTQTGAIHRVSNGSLCGSSLAAYYSDQVEHSLMTFGDS